MMIGEQIWAFVKRRLIFPSLAFLGASMIAGSIVSIASALFAFHDSLGEFLTTGSFALGVVALSIAITITAIAAIPAIICIWALRLLKAPRGWTDAGVGGAMAAILMQLTFFGLAGLTQWPTLGTGIFALAGAIGGGAYWLFVGRPQPPYSHA